jgi:hypothetical protein
MNQTGAVSSVNPPVFMRNQAIYEPVVIPAGQRNEKDQRFVEGHFRRRHELFAIKYGWEPISPDGMESDSYDRMGCCDYALLVRRHNGSVDAGCRLIRDRENMPLPIRGLLADPDSIPVGAVEISRLTGTPASARYSSRFLGYLFGYLDEIGVESVYVTIRERLLEKYEHSGFKCYERLAGKAMEKTNRDGTKEYFYPVWIGLAGYQQALHLLSRLCA